jgi:endonuclease YncB( thermonuclease family)
MNAVDREELIGLLAEALMRDATFHPGRRHWAADADRCRIDARVCAAGLVEHLHRCGRQVECVGHARDRYGRLLAVCYADGDSINERIVREGWALDFRKYSSDYLQAESAAKRAGAGIWRGQFTPPWEWRAARR